MGRRSNQRRLSSSVSAIAAVSLSVITQCASAAFELSWQPQLRIGTRATDNLRTAINDREAAWGFDMGGGLQLDLASASLSSRVSPAFNFRRFAIGEGADADEYEVRTSTEWSVVKRVTASLAFDYIRDSTLSTELTDTGRQTAVANRDTINVAPSLDILLTPRTTLNLGFYYSDVQFQQLPGTPFSNYDFKQVNGTITHALSERLSIFSNAYASEFRTPSRGGKSLTYGGMGGASYRFSESLDADFGIGYVLSDIDFQTSEIRLQLAFDPATGFPFLQQILVTTDQTTQERGPIARANIRKQWSPSLRSEVAYNRSVSPTVFGSQSSTDDVEANLIHKLSDRLLLTFRGGYNRRAAESDAIAGQNINLNRDQVLLSGGVRYRLNKEMSVNASYRFVYNLLKDIDETSSNNGLFLTFFFNGELRTYSGF